VTGRGGRSAVDDAALGVMLAERADRFGATAEREVRDALHGGLRAPSAHAGLTVLPVSVSGGVLRQPTGWVAASLIVVLLIALAGGRLTGPAAPGAPTASSGAASAPVSSGSGPSPASATPGTPSGEPAPSASPLTGSIGIDTFRAAIRTGQLDGRLVLLPGTPVERVVPCPSAATGTVCRGVAIAGLDGVPVVWDGGAGPPPLDRTPGTLAVVPDGGSLRLLGRLTTDPDRPYSFADVVSRLDVFRSDRYWVEPVSGWLVMNALNTCHPLGPAETPCPEPWPLITGAEPFPNGVLRADDGRHVAIAADAPGIDAGTAVTPGPFLVWGPMNASCSASSPDSPGGCPGGRASTWEVVARYDPATVLRVEP
jgi:hypothetical protein